MCVSNSTNAEAVYLLVHTGTSIKVAQQGTLQNGSVDFTFTNQRYAMELPISPYFNANRQPVCERLYFKRPDTI